MSPPVTPMVSLRPSKHLKLRKINPTASSGLVPLQPVVQLSWAAVPNCFTGTRAVVIKPGPCFLHWELGISTAAEGSKSPL